MEHVDHRRPPMKEIFMAEVQQTSRRCERLHYDYVIQAVSRLQMVSAERVVQFMLTKLSIYKCMEIHSSGDERTIVSFPHHAEAIRAKKLAEESELLTIDGCPYRFFVDNTYPHLRMITVNQRVSLILKNLPLHMWKDAIVEQMLSPYCALEYIDQETRQMDDPSAFTCIVRSQSLITIPDQIAIKVPENTLPAESSSRSASTTLFFNKYTVHLDKARYLHGITRRCKYRTASAANPDHIVSSAECYVSSYMLDAEAIRKYSSAVILHPKLGTHFADLQHVCYFVRKNLHIRVKAKLLNDDAFLLHFDRDYPSMSLYEELTELFLRWINSGDVQLIQWTPEYGSVGFVATQTADLKIKGLLCNLNSVQIIEYILSPFAFVKMHTTKTDDSTLAAGDTVTTYRCTVCCRAMEIIPSLIRIKMIPSHLTDLTKLSSDDKCKCLLLDASVQARPVLVELSSV